MLPHWRGLVEAAPSARETFLAEAKKIGEMYKTFFATAFTKTAL
jgi:hypothetical protein